MELLWPNFLILLGLIPLLVLAYIWILRRRKRFRVRYSSLALVRAAQPPKASLRRHVPFALFLLALASLGFAMTRPVAVMRVPVIKRTVVLAIDVSRSMCSTDIQPSRILAAKAAATSFVEREGGSSLVGLVAFSGFAAIIQSPTADSEMLLDAIKSLNVARRTAIGSGILKSIDAIAEVDKTVPLSVFGPASADTAPARPKGSFTPAIIVLLTDGVSNVGPDPLDAAQQAVNRGIRVYTIGFGTSNEVITMPNCGGGGPPNDPNGFGFGGGNFGGGGGGGGNFGGGGGGFRRGIDEVTLKKIAELTGGEYFSAESASQLQTIFDKLPVDLITRIETLEISVFFAAFGALLAGVALVLAMLWNPLF